MTGKIIVLNENAAEVPTGALVLPMFEGQERLVDLFASNESVAKQIRCAISRGDFTGKHGQQCLIHADGVPAERIVLAGLGSLENISREGLRRAGAKTMGRLKEGGVTRCALPEASFELVSGAMQGRHCPLFYFLEGGLLGLYEYREFRSGGAEDGLLTVAVCGVRPDFPLKWLEANVKAVSLARDLVNLPSNLKTPPLLAQKVRDLTAGRLSTRVLSLPEIEREGMEAYLAVGQGSANPPKFIIMEHQGSDDAPIVLIGKSVTFDSGGISLKPAEGMEKMKYDMAGGAAVLAVLLAAAELGMARHLVGILPVAENLPGGRAMRPGDVVKTILGKTVEIVSTDAEGRLSLADAMGYALKYFTPRLVIDVATLTGACAVALGGEAIAMMGNDQDFMDLMRAASDEVHERVWQMPLFEEYGDLVKGDIADLKNSGGRKGSLVSAGYFLKEFAGSVPWIHLDIAGTAWTSKEKPYCAKGATGIGARLLLQFLSETQ